MAIPLRVLIVEDDPDDAELLVEELRKGGYDETAKRVDTAEGLRAALEQSEWDIVISDFAMPHFDGAAALSLLREVELDLPFILISGTIGEDVAVEAMKSGASDYILKGHMARLLPAIRRELREAEVRRERRRAEEEVKSLARFPSENLSPVLRVSGDGTILYANPASSHLLDCWKSGVGQPISAELGELVSAVQSSGESRVADVECDDRLFSFEIAPVAGADYVNMYGRDITEHRKLEAQFLQAQKMEAVGRLAGGVAHDFNNLLTIITGYSALTLKDLGERDPMRADIEGIERAAERAAGLTRQLLAFSRRQVLRPKVIDLNTVVADMEKMLRRLIGEDVELTTVLEPELGHVNADPGQVEQVIMNLAINARDAMPKGGKLTVETRNVELDEAYVNNHFPAQTGSYVMIAMSDTGCGMDEETRSHIFDPFFTTKEEGRGTGLGLSTVYGIVKQSDGYIWVYSEPGRGTTFKIYLPRVAEAVEAPQPSVSAQSERGSETVVLVEDEDVVRTVARRILKRSGYTVLEARNGGEALLICEQHKGQIDLMITDVVMPGMSGPELFDRLASVRPEMRVLFMSGYTDDAILRHGALEPGTEFIEKPFTPDALARKVREVLDAPKEGNP